MFICWHWRTKMFLNFIFEIISWLFENMRRGENNCKFYFEKVDHVKCMSKTVHSENCNIAFGGRRLFTWSTTTRVRKTLRPQGCTKQWSVRRKFLGLCQKTNPALTQNLLQGIRKHASFSFQENTLFGKGEQRSIRCSCQESLIIGFFFISWVLLGFISFEYISMEIRKYAKCDDNWWMGDRRKPNQQKRRTVNSQWRERGESLLWNKTRSDAFRPRG